MYEWVQASDYDVAAPQLGTRIIASTAVWKRLAVSVLQMKRRSMSSHTQHDGCTTPLHGADDPWSFLNFCNTTIRTTLEELRVRVKQFFSMCCR